MTCSLLNTYSDVLFLLFSSSSIDLIESRSLYDSQSIVGRMPHWLEDCGGGGGLGIVISMPGCEVAGYEIGNSTLRMKTFSGGVGVGIGADILGFEGKRFKCCEFSCADDRSRPYVASGAQYSASLSSCMGNVDDCELIESNFDLWVCRPSRASM